VETARLPKHRSCSPLCSHTTASTSAMMVLS